MKLLGVILVFISTTVFSSTCEIQYGVHHYDKLGCYDTKVLEIIDSNSLENFKSYIDYTIFNEKISIGSAEFFFRGSYNSIFKNSNRTALRSRERNLLWSMPGIVYYLVKLDRLRMLDFILKKVKSKSLSRIALGFAGFLQNKEIEKMVSYKYLKPIEIISINDKNFNRVKDNPRDTTLAERNDFYKELMEDGSHIFFKTKKLEKVEYLIKSKFDIVKLSNLLVNSFDFFEQVKGKGLDLLFSNGLTSKTDMDGSGSTIYMLLLGRRHNWVIDYYKDKGIIPLKFNKAGEHYYTIFIKGNKTYKFDKFHIKAETKVTKNGITAIEYAWIHHKYPSFFKLYNGGNVPSVAQKAIRSPKKVAREIKRLVEELVRESDIDYSKLTILFKVYKNVVKSIDENNLHVNEYSLKYMSEQESIMHKVLNEKKWLNERVKKHFKEEVNKTSISGKEISLKGDDNLKGFISVGNGSISLSHTNNRKNKGVLINRLACLDNKFKIKDLIEVYEYKVNDKIVDAMDGRQHRFSGYSHLGVEKDLSCSYAINLDRTDNLKLPFTYSSNNYSRTWEPETVSEFKSGKSNVVISLGLKNEVDILRDDASKNFYIYNKRLKKKSLAGSYYCDLDNEKGFLMCYSFTRLISSGDFNGDGIVDIFMDPSFDGKSRPYVLYLSKKDGTYEKVIVDAGGC